jgi:hypothetical protein
LTSLKVDLLQLERLPHEDLELWRGYYAKRANVVSIPESPDFLVTLAKAIKSCRLIRLQSGSDVVGYIPIYQPHGYGFAYPIPMSDYQGIAYFGPSQPNFRHILREAGIHRWSYENATESRGLDACSHRFQCRLVPLVTMVGSAADYLSARAKQGVKFHAARKLFRKLAREKGELSLVRKEASEASIFRLLQCKQLRQPSKRPFAKHVQEALLHFARLRCADLRAELYVLKAGDVDVAYTFNLEMGACAYGWFCSFEPEYARYSPGTLLILKLIEDMHARNFRSFDLGPGGESWKERFATSHRTVYLGQVFARVSRKLGGQGARNETPD